MLQKVDVSVEELVDHEEEHGVGREKHRLKREILDLHGIVGQT